MTQIKCNIAQFRVSQVDPGKQFLSFKCQFIKTLVIYLDVFVSNDDVYFVAYSYEVYDLTKCLCEKPYCDATMVTTRVLRTLGADSI